MPGWIGPAVAGSLIVIALCYLIIGAVVIIAIKETAEQSKALGRELADLRADLAPTLDAVRRMGEKGFQVAELAEMEAKEIVATTRKVRQDLERGIARAKDRLADFDATVEVVQQEIDATVVEVGAALESARAGVGMIAQLRRVVRPRRRR
jgi:hypothetical protein